MRDSGERSILLRGMVACFVWLRPWLDAPFAAFPGKRRPPRSLNIVSGIDGTPKVKHRSPCAEGVRLGCRTTGKVWGASRAAGEGDSLETKNGHLAKLSRAGKAPALSRVTSCHDTVQLCQMYRESRIRRGSRRSACALTHPPAAENGAPRPANTRTVRVHPRSRCRF